jgi:hypothetical protein
MLAGDKRVFAAVGRIFVAATRHIDVTQDFSQHSLRAALGGRSNRECLP